MTNKKNSLLIPLPLVLILLGCTSCRSSNPETSKKDKISERDKIAEALPDNLINDAEDPILRGLLREIREYPPKIDAPIAVRGIWRGETGDYTALQMAARMGEFEVVEGIVKAGANLNAQNGKGEAALHMAASAFETEIIEALIAAGADVNLQDNSGDTALHRSLHSNRKGRKKETVTLLAQRKEIDFSRRNKGGLTPLELAESLSFCGYADIIREAIKDRTTH